MATRDEVAEGYAARIHTAAAREPAQRSAAALRSSPLARTLREIDRDIAGLADQDNRPLTESIKTDIVDRLADRLGVDRSRFKVVLREASNENFLQLVTYWDEFLQDLRT